MNELINVEQRTIGQQSVPTVNARELHAFLQSKQDFSNWINNRINQYGFVENIDYILVLNQQDGIFNKIIENSKNTENKRGRPSKDYFISLNMAKELSMVERTDKGRQARLYFIECEQKLYALTAQQVQQTNYQQGIKNANWHITQLVHTLKDVVKTQQKQMDKIIDLQEQSLELLRIATEQRNHVAVKRHRQATADDYVMVKDLLKQGYTFGQISEQLNISTYAVHGIKHDKVVATESGLLKRIGA